MGLTQVIHHPRADTARKRIQTRRPSDRSQRIRRIVQLSFLALNLGIGVQFYMFVRFHETGGQSLSVVRPPGIEGWLPIASLMNWKSYFATGEIPAIHPAGMFLLAAFVAMAFLLRNSFCGWLCPVGTVSERLWKFGRETFGRNFRLPRWLDLPLRGLKYILMGLFLYAIGGMSTAAIRAFLDGPYGVIADVKMLNFFRHLGIAGAVVLGVLLIGSVFVRNVWCRYLCPYGALLGLFARFSPVRIRRDAGLCIDCAKCAKACPSLLPVDQLITIRSTECIACYECVAACPADGALEMKVGGRARVPAWAFAAALAMIFFGFVGYARFTGHWRTDVPSHVYFELVPQAQEFGHP